VAQLLPCRARLETFTLAALFALSACSAESPLASAAGGATARGGNAGSAGEGSSAASQGGAGGSGAVSGAAGSAASAGASGLGGGGSGGAGGSSGAGGNAGSAGAAVTCVTEGTELCDDFESGSLDPSRWQINKPSSSALVSVDQEHARSGSYAVHFKVVAGEQSTAQITENVTFPAADDALYARAYAYFSPGIPLDNEVGVHMGFIQASGDNEYGRVRSALGSIGDQQFLGYSIYFGPPFEEFGPWSELKVAPTSWLCLELFVSGSGGLVAERRIWVDDVELEEQHNTYDGQKPPAFDLIAFGIWQYHPTPTLTDVWMDDIRVSSQRIGCDD
jgi:hypothetical protein